MKSRNRKLVVSVFGIVAVLLIGILAVGQTVQASPGSIFGSWSVVVTTVGQGVTFPALLTFTSDGSVLADEPPAAGETTGHGNWLRGSHGQVNLTFVSLYSDPATGAYAGKLKVVAELQRDPGDDGWSGPFKITVFDPGDQVVFSDTGTFTLTRIAVESLD